MESKFYYAGLPTAPILIARSSTTPWEEAPTGPGLEVAYPRRRKVLRYTGDHAIKHVWEEQLDIKIHTLLDSMKIKWTSIDVVRIGYDGESFAPVIFWIEVIPASLSSAEGIILARKCREIIEEYRITDVDVEIHQPVVT
ncbi:hypothetical protein F5888DRAFT_1610419 [Russula emetica]|nr:hypothetical protein F5888DRAFT_1610419 [Russula emetica]